ncbi:GNAT family N-acetyltransferase [Halomonas sp. KO116]|uniref:GNAT family N-acetyltransferase n=1 Tax=Halomonas sp. KO116 TaxID=1504981 RepID=UPI0004E34E8C|nr:GNAT family N-acetyltransferase [Halomonas sp. KO116]AJY53145.1 hypothetical protein KO116_P200038 [Halomonas sp. KO116]
MAQQFPSELSLSANDLPTEPLNELGSSTPKSDLDSVITKLKATGSCNLSDLRLKDFPILTYENIGLYSYVSVDLGVFRPGHLILFNIAVDENKRSVGLGSKALKLILSVADELNMSVELFARSHSRSPLSGQKLASWYERNGFRARRGGHYRDQKLT